VVTSRHSEVGAEEWEQSGLPGLCVLCVGLMDCLLSVCEGDVHVMKREMEREREWVRSVGMEVA
jgi:ferredoxin